MNNLEKEIFQRAYQSYLCGSDNYSYKFASTSENMLKKYNSAIKNLEKEGFITINFKSEDKVKMLITEKGIEYGNFSLDM